MAKHALLVRGLLQALHPVLRFGPVAGKASILLALGIEDFLGLFVVLMMTAGAVVLFSGVRGDALGVHVPEVQDLVQPGIQPHRGLGSGIVAGAAETVQRAGLLARRGHLVVTANAARMIDVFELPRLGRLRAFIGQIQLVVLDGVAGLAVLLLFEQHLGMLVVEERDRRQLKLSERGQGVDLDQVRLSRLGRLRRLPLTPGLDADE